MNTPTFRPHFTRRSLVFTSTLLVLLSLAALLGCEKTFVRKKGDKALDIQGAYDYEMTMLRNPQTETIPDGTFEAERSQARQVFESQRSSGRPLVNSYTFQGPDNLGGRTRAVVYDKRFDGAMNRVIIAGGVSGGIYKSSDDGATWTRKSPTGEHFSCTSIAQDTRPGMEDTWYYSVGEAYGNSASGSGASYGGNGVYKSTDNGETWARLPASNITPLETFTVPEDYITKIIVDPTNGNVYIACAAVIRRSVDGGLTWTSVLAGPLSFSSQFTDIVVTSTGRLYAAFGGTNDSSVDGVWASPPGPMSGDPFSWTRIAGVGAGGSPVGWNSEPSYGRIVLAIAPSDEKFLYAMYFSGTSPVCPTSVKEAELFRWDDMGGTWTDLSATLPDAAGCLAGNDPFAVQGGYDLVIAVKPDDASTLFIGGTNAYRSIDGGVTWTRIGGYAGTGTYALYSSSHPDIHSFAFSPITSATMLCGNDGGIQRTIANLEPVVAWSQINIGYRTYQYYYVDVDPRLGNAKVIGGAQDNGSTRNIGGSGTDFEMVLGGDGVSVGLTDLIGGIQYEYVGFQFGEIFRRDSTLAPGVAGSYITPTPEAGTGTGLFVTLFKLDSDNPEFLYYANDSVLYRTSSASTVTGGTWTTMSGVTSAVSPDKKITALAMARGPYSPATSSLYIGASDTISPFTVPPKLFRLDDPAFIGAGAPPADISSPAFPVGAYISSIAVDPTTDDTVMVTFSNYGVSSVFLTMDASSVVPTWSAIEGNIPLPSVRSSAILRKTAGVEYFVGTSVGLYMTTTPAGVGTIWSQEGPSEMGNAVISSLALRPSDNKLLVGTHGYGMWYLIPPTAANVSVSGRVHSPSGGIANAVVTITSPNGTALRTSTSSLGYFRFDDIVAGSTYTVAVASKRYRFTPRIVTISDSVEDLDFIPN